MKSMTFVVKMQQPDSQMFYLGDISDTQVVVITIFAGHAAEEMEQQVTVPIERALNSVPAAAAA